MLHRLFRIIRAHIRRANSNLATMPEEQRAALLDFIRES